MLLNIIASDFDRNIGGLKLGFIFKTSNAQTSQGSKYLNLIFQFGLIFWSYTFHIIVERG